MRNKRNTGADGDRGEAKRRTASSKVNLMNRCVIKKKSFGKNSTGRGKGGGTKTARWGHRNLNIGIIRCLEMQLGGEVIKTRQTKPLLLKRDRRKRGEKRASPWDFKSAQP